MLTLEQAIEHCHKKAEELKKDADYLDAPYGMDTSARTDCLECARDHEQLAEWLTELQERREADKWENAKERKPEKDGEYLVVVEFQHILLVTYYDAESEHWGTANSVIAWRPLPEYKESEDK